jgi:hypothetical protein
VIGDFRCCDRNERLKMKMRFDAAVAVVVMILTMGIFASPALAEYEDIEPQAVGSPDQWQTFGGTNKVMLVTDIDDFTYIYEDSAGHIEDFTLTDPGGIGGDDSIDSVNVIWRAQDNGGGTNEGRVNLRLSGSTARPGGSGWTIDDVNGLEVQTECTAIAKSREIRCSKIYVRVYYTAPPANLSSRRRKIKMQFGG